MIELSSFITTSIWEELAFLNAGISLTLTDKRVIKEDGSFKSELFRSEEGLKEFVRYVDRSKESLIPDVIHIVTEKQGIPVEVAMTYNTSFNESVFSYVNDINTIEGGTHLAGFRRGLTRTLKKYAEDSKLLEKAKVEIQGDDFREGLTAVISIKVAEPQFEGQTKTKLGNSEVTGAVDQAIGEALGYYLEEHPKEAKIIVDKVVLAAQARQAARKARELVQRKSPMTGGGLPGKLADCSSNHDDNLVVAELAQVQFLRIFLCTDSNTHCTEDVLDFFTFEHFVVHRLFYVQDLTTKRQDSLEHTVAALFSRTTCRVPFDQE